MLRTVQPPRPVTPAIYDAVIADASLQSMQWRKSRGNPHGMSLKVGVELEDETGSANIFDVIDITHVGRLQALFNAAGIPFSNANWRDCVHLLPGRQVSVVPKNITPQAGPHAGRTKAVVSCWIASDSQR